MATIDNSLTMWLAVKNKTLIHDIIAFCSIFYLEIHTQTLAYTD